MLILRFLKKHKFQVPATRSALLQHIRFRLTNQIDTTSLNTFIASSKCPENLFRFLPQTDSEGRPVGLLSLKEAAGMSQDELLRFFSMVFDVARRWLKEINEARWINEVECGEDYGNDEDIHDIHVETTYVDSPPTHAVVITDPAGEDEDFVTSNSKPPLPRPPPEAADSSATVVDDHLDTELLTPPRTRQRAASISSSALSISIPTPRRILSDDDVLKRSVVAQMSLVVDLDGVGVSNFNTQLPQPLLHLMSAHFPAMLANSYVLNFRWVHQGLWTVVKNLLPSGATNRIFFASNVEELGNLLGVPKETVAEGNYLLFIVRSASPANTRLHSSCTVVAMPGLPETSPSLDSAPALYLGDVRRRPFGIPGRRIPRAFGVGYRLDARRAGRRGRRPVL